MRILFDHTIFITQKYGGISRYIVRLAQEFLGLGDHVDVMAWWHQNQLLRELPPERVHGYMSGRLPRLAPSGINTILSLLFGRKFRPDVLHETYCSRLSSSFDYGQKCHVVTVHDMLDEMFPAYCGVFSRVPEKKLASVTRSDHIICVSNCTKNDLVRLLGVNPEKISVIYHGVDRFLAPDPDNNVEYSSPPYLLYVGRRAGYKNFTSMLRAVASSRRLADGLGIIAYGEMPFTSQENELVHSLGFRSGAVRHVSGGDDALARLYRSATALVYPSIYEGFGLPPLEAMACDCPVVSSRAGPMPEVSGDAAEYFDPMDIEEQAVAIEKVVFDGTRRAALVERGRERVGQFSWSRCAAETRALYQRLLP